MRMKVVVFGVLVAGFACGGLAGAAFAAGSGCEIYSLPAGDPRYDGFAVTIDGRAAPVSLARCSAMPFNRRWPGHQRDIAQSEPCGFVRFALSRPVEVAVTVKRAFTNAVIRPLSRGVKPVRDGQILRFRVDGPGFYSVEVDGHHNNLTLFADAPETEKVTPGEKGLRYFGPGSHDIGLVELKTGEHVYLDSGAVVYGAFIASNATDIAISGRGILDMSRIKEEILFDVKTGDGGMAVLNAKREFLTRFTCCNRIRIDGVTMRDSLCYNIGMFGCEDIRISNVKIIGQWRYNTDGIDLHNCRRSHVTGCYVRTFDDSLCFKAHEGWGNCEDGVFEKCVVWNDWGKPLEVGVECRAEYLQRLTFRDIDVIHMIGQPMDVVNVDYGTVRDVLFENIRAEQDDLIPLPQIQKSDEAVFDEKKGVHDLPLLYASSINIHPEYSHENGGKWSGGGHIDGVTVRDIDVCSPAGRLEIVQRGLDAAHRNVGLVFENVRLNGKPFGPAYGNAVMNTNAFTACRFVDAADDAAKNHSTQMNQGEPSVLDRGSLGGTRVLVIGNSIACHQPLAEIGWTNCWGMAASAKEKDFAHLIAAEVTRRTGREAHLRVKSGFALEKAYRTVDIGEAFADEIAFRPDILVIALGENARVTADDAAAWTDAQVRLVKAIRAAGCNPIVVMRGPFWPNAVKANATEAAAKALGAKFVDTGHLGKDPANKAIGLFWHKGVAGHPGDLGMKRIADVILRAIYPDAFVNGGFESTRDGKSLGWELPAKNTFWRLEPGAGLNGTTALVFENHVKGLPREPFRYTPFQEVDVGENGGEFRFECWIRAENIECDRQGASMYVTWQDAEGRYRSQWGKGCVMGTQERWSLNCGVAVIPPGSTHVQVHFAMREHSTGKAYYDNAVFAPLTGRNVTGLYSSSYRDTATGGKVRFFSTQHLDAKLPLADLKPVFSFTDRDGKCRDLAPAAFTAENAEVEIDVGESFALGETPVVFTLRDGDGKLLGAATNRFVKTAAPIDRRVYVDEHQRVILEGKPFFPLGMFTVMPYKEELELFANSPFNCFRINRRERTKEAQRAALDLVHSYGLKVLYHLIDYFVGEPGRPEIRTLADEYAAISNRVDQIVDHPALLAWYMSDEKPVSEIAALVRHQEWMKQLDPDHPTWTCIINENARYSADYLGTADAIGTDPYPLGMHLEISECLKSARCAFRAARGARAIWQIPQAFDWAAYRNVKDTFWKDARAPTKAEMRNMWWQAIAAGANGIIAYTWGRKRLEVGGKTFEERWRDICEVGEEIKARIPILLSVEPAPAVSGETETIGARVWRHEGRTYLLVVNASYEPQTAVLTVGGEKIRKALAPLEVSFGLLEEGVVK